MILFQNQNRDTVFKNRQFGRIFIAVCNKVMPPVNIKPGFQATGNYPSDPSAIRSVDIPHSTVPEAPS
jgi:hypothetical protein